MQIFDLKSLVLLRISPFLHVLQGIAGDDWCSNFLRGLLMVYVKFRVLKVDEIDHLAIFLRYRGEKLFM